MNNQIVNRKPLNTSMLYLIVFKIISMGSSQLHATMEKNRKNKTVLTKAQIEQSRFMVIYITNIIVGFIIQCMLLISIIIQLLFSVLRNINTPCVKDKIKTVYDIWLYSAS